MLVEAWRRRNQRWAAQHLTPAKSELFQRRWNRISRFSLLSFSLLAGPAIALSYELFFLVTIFVMTSFVRANIQVFHVLPVIALLILPVALLMGILLAATYHCCMREYAKLQPGNAA